MKRKKKVIKRKRKTSKRRMKILKNLGQVSLIAVILLILIGIVLIYFAFTVFVGTTSGASAATGAEIESRITEIRTNFVLGEQDGIKIFIRNTGSVSIEWGELVVYIDDVNAMGSIPETIHPGKTGYMRIWGIFEIPEGETATLRVPGTVGSQSMTITGPEEINE